MLHAKNIQLRALEPEDLNFLYQIENDTQFWEVSNTQTPFSKYILTQYLANSNQDIYEAKQLRLIIDYKNKAIGTIDLFDFNAQHKRAGIGILLLKEFQKQGYAYEAIQILIQYAFETLALHQIYANISPENKASIRLFEKCNFIKTGIQKDWQFKNNQYKDIHFYQLINKL